MAAGDSHHSSERTLSSFCRPPISSSPLLSSLSLLHRQSTRRPARKGIHSFCESALSASPPLRLPSASLGLSSFSCNSTLSRCQQRSGSRPIRICLRRAAAAASRGDSSRVERDKASYYCRTRPLWPLSGQRLHYFFPICTGANPRLLKKRWRKLFFSFYYIYYFVRVGGTAFYTKNSFRAKKGKR